MTTRNTTQKKVIRAVLEIADRPLSPDEIWREARKKSKGLGVATVYRAIKGFSEEGELQSVEVPGEPPRYEIAGKPHHHHFHCRRCGRVFEIEGCPGDLKRLIPKGFRLTGHEVMLYGECASCA